MMPHDPNFAWTVGELNRYAQNVVKTHLGDTIWLCGELGRIQLNASGHVYGVLKDELGNSISFAFFGGARKVAPLRLTAGDCVLLWGNLDLYVTAGTYQFVARDLRPSNTQGGLMQRYLETRKRLDAEGLFARERKKPLPLRPQVIAVITSPSGAALQDFLKTAYSRVPNLHVRIVPSPMQGQGTALKVASAVKCLNAWQACDVIVITRGGGSMEDLWEFNDETLARTVADSAIPVVSAVGHQIDVTMLDYVADVSVITPTQAANAVTESALQMATALDTFAQRLPRAMRHLLDTARLRFTRAASCAYLQRPQDLYHQQAQRLDNAQLRLANAPPRRARELRLRLDELRRRLPTAIARAIADRQARLKNLALPLSALDPKGVLQRGYSILLDADQRAIRAPQDTHPGQAVTALLSKGTINLEVK
ncbi:exodeoxyribonuclease VII large subunit [uncultured Fibrobacter sp.]|uniref:exodeoxyribonuclease VII large subunit n=1 Tax=uncultured Fibrobacter sp. TaxID=261512 RepID=UPI0025E807D3|nr:exodeoxyribonuclease VII large subunit [uncultured Fibrobacter sp.]